MRGICIKTGLEKDIKLSIVHLLFLLSGIYCILIPLSILHHCKAWSYFFTFALCLFLWGAYRIGRKWACRITTVFWILWFIFCVLYWHTLTFSVSYAQLFNSSAVSIDFFSFFFSGTLSLLFFTLEFILNSHLFLWLLTTTVLLLESIVGMQPSTEVVILTMLFQLSFCAIHTVGLRQQHNSFALKKRENLTATCSILIADILAVALILALPITKYKAQMLYAPAYALEGFFHRITDKFSRSSSEPVTGGSLSRGNNYFSGREHLSITVTRPPKQSLYLRNFSGGDYTGEKWVAIEDNTILEKMGIDMHECPWIPRNSHDYYVYNFSNESQMRNPIYMNPIYTFYYMLNRQTSNKDAIVMHIFHTSGNYQSYYAPYYSHWKDNTSAPGYIYKFFERADINIDWESNVLDTTWYRRFQKAYMNEIQDIFTRVPIERLPRLSKLCLSADVDGLEEITAFILSTLHERASYTLTPGWTPFNEDIAEYFLFENQQGYCEHFATCATLMYRLFGVPARYTTGYLVTPDSFVLGEDGYYHASVKDFSAHAWTEIFIENYGWTPIEATPAALGFDDSFSNIPGIDREKISRLLTTHPWSWDFPKVEEKSSVQFPKSSFSHFELKLGQITFRGAWVLSIGIVISIVALFFPVIVLRRRWYLKHLTVMDCRGIFGRLTKMLCFARILSEWDGQEDHFPERLCASLPNLSYEDALQVYQSVLSAAYSSNSATEEENIFARRFYKETAEAVSAKLDWRQRLLFRFWHIFG